MIRKRFLFLFLALAALLSPVVSSAITPRDTVYVSDRYTTHVLMPTDIETVESDEDLLTLMLSSPRPEMMALRAKAPFDGTTVVSVEGVDGAFRFVAVAYAARPEHLLEDFRPGAPMTMKRESIPVVEISRQKAMHVILPGRVRYADLGADGLLTSDVVGKGNRDVAIKAQKAFQDSTNITFCDSTGTLHMYLARYRKSIKKTNLTLRENPDRVPVPDMGEDRQATKPQRLVARDTVFVSTRFTTYAVFPERLSSITLSCDTLFKVAVIDGREDVVLMNTAKPFSDVVVMTAEDLSGAYRLVAVAYDKRPERLVTDLRKGGSASRRMADMGVADVSTKKNLKFKLPGYVTYANLGTNGVVLGDIVGAGKSEMNVKSKSSFKDTTNVTMMDSDGNIHMYLVRYNKSFKGREIDLRPPVVAAVEEKPAATKAQEKQEQKKQETVVVANKKVSDDKAAQKDDKTRKNAVKNNDDAFGAVILVADEPVKPKETKSVETVAPPLPAASSYTGGGRDTIFVSDVYTTHLIFSTEINYADLSNQTVIAAKIIEGSKNKLALKARSAFNVTASVSVEEADGTFHTYIVAYKREPGALIVDKRPGAENFDMSKIETVEVSDKYTTHLIFATDIGYADLSRPSVLSGKLVDQGKNKLALMARGPFNGRANVSVEEANGVFHTYLLKYAETPQQLVFDTREDVVQKDLSGDVAAAEVNTGSKVKNSREKEATARRRPKGVAANNLRRTDAPLLSEVIEMNQMLYHTGTRNYRLTFMCENIFSYSDITYFVLTLKNDSGISYETGDAVFVLESSNGARRKIVYESNIFPKNRFGKLTTAAHSEGKVAYSFDKITLSKDQVIKIYLYESNGSRNLVLTLTAKDVNGAVAPF